MTDFFAGAARSIMCLVWVPRPGGSVIVMSAPELGNSEMENLLSRPDDRPPNAEEILRRLRDQLVDAHRRKIQRAADGASPPSV